MEAKIKKAYDRLKEFEMFSEEYETFHHFFHDNLKEDKKDEAIELLLMTIFFLFKSHGEKFNTLLTLVSEEKKQNLIFWVEDSIKKMKE